METCTICTIMSLLCIHGGCGECRESQLREELDLYLNDLIARLEADQGAEYLEAEAVQ